MTETQSPPAAGVTIDGGRFVRGAEPHQLISGALHYFRVPPALWPDRLQRLAAMGCNPVETYVAWNFHQPWRDRAPSFDGDRDLGAFLDLAAAADLDLLRQLRDRLIELGIDGWLFTSDGPGQLWLQGGMIDDTLATINFGSRQESAFATLAERRPGQPEMCMEFWNGWFDHFGGDHHTRPGDDAAAELAGISRPADQ